MQRYARYFFLAGMVMVAACAEQPSISSPTSFPTPSKAAVALITATSISSSTRSPLSATTTPTLSPLHCASIESELPIISSGAYQDWCKYSNPEYGFSLAIPSHWSICSRSENFIAICPQLNPNVAITIGFRRAAEDIQIQRTGVGAGDISTRGSVEFLGQSVPRNVLIYQEKIKAVLYNNAVETPSGDLIFTLSLDDWGVDYEAVSLSQEIQDTADKIVESIKIE